MHDGRLLTLEDTVEFFNLILSTKLTTQEKQDLVAFIRTLYSWETTRSSRFDGLSNRFGGKGFDLSTAAVLGVWPSSWNISSADRLKHLIKESGRL